MPDSRVPHKKVTLIASKAGAARRDTQSKSGRSEVTLRPRRSVERDGCDSSLNDAKCSKQDENECKERKQNNERDRHARSTRDRDNDITRPSSRSRLDLKDAAEVQSTRRLEGKGNNTHLTVRREEQKCAARGSSPPKHGHVHATGNSKSGGEPGSHKQVKNAEAKISHDRHCTQSNSHQKRLADEDLDRARHENDPSHRNSSRNHSSRGEKSISARLETSPNKRYDFATKRTATDERTQRLHSNFVDDNQETCNSDSGPHSQSYTKKKQQHAKPAENHYRDQVGSQDGRCHCDAGNEQCEIPQIRTNDGCTRSRCEHSSSAHGKDSGAARDKHLAKQRGLQRHRSRSRSRSQSHKNKSRLAQQDNRTCRHRSWHLAASSSLQIEDSGTKSSKSHGHHNEKEPFEHHHGQSRTGTAASSKVSNALAHPDRKQDTIETKSSAFADINCSMLGAHKRESCHSTRASGSSRGKKMLGTEHDEQPKMMDQIHKKDTGKDFHFAMPKHVSQDNKLSHQEAENQIAGRANISGDRHALAAHEAVTAERKWVFIPQVPEGVRHWSWFRARQGGVVKARFDGPLKSSDRRCIVEMESGHAASDLVHALMNEGVLASQQDNPHLPDNALTNKPNLESHHTARVTNHGPSRGPVGIESSTPACSSDSDEVPRKLNKTATASQKTAVCGPGSLVVESSPEQESAWTLHTGPKAPRASRSPSLVAVGGSADGRPDLLSEGTTLSATECLTPSASAAPTHAQPDRRMPSLPTQSFAGFPMFIAEAPGPMEPPFIVPASFQQAYSSGDCLRNAQSQIFQEPLYASHSSSMNNFAWPCPCGKSDAGVTAPSAVIPFTAAACPSSNAAVDLGAVAGIVAGATAQASSFLSTASNSRWVLVKNLTPEVSKRPVQWFQKRCGGRESESAPIDGWLCSPEVSPDGSSQAILEFRDVSAAEATVTALEAWKLGIPRMRAQLISRAQAQLLNCQWLLARNLPAEIRNLSFFKTKHEDVDTGIMYKDSQYGRSALVRLRTVTSATELCSALNGLQKNGAIFAQQISEMQKNTILNSISEVDVVETQALQGDGHNVQASSKGRIPCCRSRSRQGSISSSSSDSSSRFRRPGTQSYTKSKLASSGPCVRRADSSLQASPGRQRASRTSPTGNTSIRHTSPVTSRRQHARRAPRSTHGPSARSRRERSWTLTRPGTACTNASTEALDLSHQFLV